ncbi:MAG: hypothetical protein Kow0080_18380 [Candidatus Promineifilaceae bacterium]
MLLVGYTAVFIGYFQVWLPGPSAGLQLMGLEMGEWLKFLGVGAQRDWFYVPPVSLALLLILPTFFWPRSWRTWGMRGTAVLAALLAFPAVEDITGAAKTQYMLRAGMVGFVLLTALLAGFVRWRNGRFVVWLLMLLVAAAGLAGPLWVYIQIRPFLAETIKTQIGFGIGLWLNTLGHLLIIAAAKYSLPQA